MIKLYIVVDSFGDTYQIPLCDAHTAAASVPGLTVQDIDDTELDCIVCKSIEKMKKESKYEKPI